MRRDGKLADAIVPQTDRRASVEPRIAPLTAGKMAIKCEAGEEEAELGSPLRQKLDRRENASPPEAPQTNQSTTSKAISALIDETSTARRRTSSNFTTTKPLDEPTSKTTESNAAHEPIVKEEAADRDNLAIFDFNESSPVDATRPKMNDLAKAARNARRHSSVPALATNESDKSDGALPSLHKRTGSGTAKTVTTTSLAKSTSAARLNAKKASAPLSTAPKTVDTKTKVDSAAAAAEAEKASATSSLRAERIASRRKSMLL
jgi:hypothetical protein